MLKLTFSPYRIQRFDQIKSSYPINIKLRAVIFICTSERCTIHERCFLFIYNKENIYNFINKYINKGR